MVLFPFLAGLALVVGASVYAAVKGVSLWRQAKQTGGAITDELALFEERAARAEQFLAEADSSSRHLQAATERLRVSNARLQVLLASLESARRRTRWLRALLPLR